jgi:uncharacterized repeat protein (TIGR01451 family)
MKTRFARMLLLLCALLVAFGLISVIGTRARTRSSSAQPVALPSPASHTAQPVSAWLRGPLRLAADRQINPFNFRTGSGFYFSPLLPSISVSKTATLPNTGCPGTGTFDVNCNGFVNPGDTLMYSVQISNAGSEAMGVVFTDQLNANLTLIGTALATPIAVADAYTTVGNTQLQVGSSQTVTPAVFVNGNVLTNDIDPNGGSVTATAGTGATTLGGSVTMNANGTFVYTPPVNTTGTTDTFTYTITNTGGKTDTGTISFTLTERVWYVRNNAAGGGDGRSNTPFNTLAAAQTASSINDYIFVHRGDGTTTGQNAGITLKNGQRLIGEDVALVVGAFTLTADGLPPVIGNGAGSGITLAQNNTMRGLTVGNTTAAAITGNNFGTLSLDSVTINTTNGALSLTTGTATATFLGVTSSGGTNNVALTSVAGTINLGSGALSGATGNAFDVDQGTAGISYTGTITAGGALAVDITNKMGGTVALSGAVSGTGAGRGINLNTNTGTTINFTGGVTLNTSTTAAFTATGGGTVTVTGSANTLTTTTGTALNVANTNIGASGLTFRSISANGATSGIILNATGSGGFLTVTGNGGSCSSAANCTGGAIQNTTSDGIALTNTHNVSLTRMYIASTGRHGVNGTGMTDASGNTSPTFAFLNGFMESPGDADNESALYFDTLLATNITGTMTVSDSTIQNFEDVGIHVGNQSGTLTVNVTNVLINNNSDTNGEEAIDVAAEGTANITVNVTGTRTGLTSTTMFTDMEGGGLNVIAQNSGVIDLNISGIVVIGTGGPDNFPTPPAMTFSSEGTSSTFSFDILDNAIVDSSGDGIFIGHEGTITGRINNNIISGMATGDGIRIDTDTTSNNTTTIQIDGNAIGNNATWPGIGDDGIQVLHRDGNKTLNLTINNNQIANTASEGIRYFADDDVAGGGPENQVKITNNTFSTIGDPNTIVIISQDNGTNVCTNISGNSLTTGNLGVTLQQSTGTATLQITQASTAALAAANDGGATVVTTTGTITFNGVCANPPLPMNSFAPLGDGEQKAVVKGNQKTMVAHLKEWINPVFAAFSAPVSDVKLDHAFEKVTQTLAPTAAAAEFVVPPASRSDSTAKPLPSKGVTTNKPARTIIVNSRGEYRIVPTAALPKLMAGELITINGTGTGFTLPAGESTTVMYNAQISGGFTGTSISNTANVSGTGFGPITDTETTTVVQPPSITKAFASDFVAKNGTVNLVFTITNPNPATSFTQVAFSDVLPVGLNVTITGSTSQCSGTVATDTATRTIALTGGSILAGGNCTITVPVVAGTTEGLLTNTSNAVSSFEGGTGDTATDTIIVIDPPALTKGFTPSAIPLNGTSTLQFTLSNPNTTLTLNTLSFTDTLPAGVTTPDVGATTVCTDGSYSVTSNVLSFTKPSLAAGTNCQFSITVTGTTTGTKTNTTSAVDTANSNDGTAATANLDVIAPPTISKAFGAPSLPLYTSGADTSFRTSLTFTITNPNSSGTLTGVAFSDTLPSGLVIATGPFAATSGCGPGGGISMNGTLGGNVFLFSGGQVTVGTPCTVTFNVRGTTVGTKNNVSDAITSTEGGTGGTASASIDVFAPPTLAKAFGGSTSTTIAPGDTTTMSFTFTNPAGNPGNLTGVGFTAADTLTGFQIAGTPNLTTNGQCGSPTLTGFSAASNSVNISGATVTTANPCVVTVNVTSSTPGVYTNNATPTSTQGGTGVVSNTATLTVAAPPTVAKAFAPTLITPNGTSLLTITLTNPNASLDLTGAMLTDMLPAGLNTVPATVLTNCSPGTPSQTGDSVSLSGATIPQGGSCTLTVQVTSAATGVYTNTIDPGALTTSNSGPNTNTATATLTVANPPTLSKAFAPNPILPNGTSTLTITLTNPNSNVPLTLSSPLTDTLPANVTTDGGTAATSCSGGTPSQMTGSVTLTGGTIPTSGSCTLTVNVTSATAGGHLNTIAAGALATNGGTNADPATATLVVGNPPAVTKTFSPDKIKTGATTAMTIAITNNNPTDPFNNVSFTDTLPAGLTVPDAAATTQCGTGTLTVASNVITLTGGTINANTTCTLTFTATGATPGVKTNSVTVNTANFGSGTGSGTVTVYDVPTLSKGFSPMSVPFGGTSTLSFTLTNPNSFTGGELSGLSFSDTLPAGVTVGTSSTSACGGTLTTTAPNLIAFSGGTLGTANPANTCTLNVTVTGTQLGMHTNTVTSLTATETGANPVSAMATLTVTQSPTTTTITSDLPDPSVVGEPYAVNVTVAASMGGMGTPGGTVNVSDGTGATCNITLSGGSGSCNLTSTTAGAKTLTANYVGDTNFTTSSDTEAHTVNKANTTTTITNAGALGAATVVGQSYAVNWSVTVNTPGALGAALTGSVTVSDGAQTCTAAVSAGTCDLISTTPGSKNITATYAGDSNYNMSTSSPATPHQVNKADTTVAITNDTPDPSVFGQNYAVTASVSVTSPGGGTPSGTITVSDGTNNCMITLPGGTSCNLPSTSVGAKTLTATYSGDTNYNGSGPSVGVPHTVNKADVNVAITSDNPDSSAVGQNVTVVFTVTAASPGTGTPTGNVTVSDGVNSCTGTVAAGQCVVALTTPGNRTLTASYAGDANFNGGTSAGEAHTVVAPPSIAKAFSPASVPVGQTSTLTITITNPAANTVSLTGVGFTDNFPTNVVVANPLTVNNSCGGTLTDSGGGGLGAGDTGIMLSGGTVGTTAPRTCTISVNVTPTAQGPHVNTINSVTSSNGGTNNTPASATLLTNTPPTISSNTVPVKAGSNAVSFTIATAVDPDQPVNTLGITINGNPTTASSNGVTVSNLAIQAGGAVTANIATTCAATTATFTLVVTDSENATGTGTLTVNVQPDMGPVLGYGNQVITAGTTPAFAPASGPADNGTVQSIVLQSVAPNNGGLTVGVNNLTGAVSVVSATLIGTYTVTVKATDTCGQMTLASFTVQVVCPTVTLSPATLPQGTGGVSYNQMLSAAPAGGNYSFAVTGGSLPPGLALANNGALSGTPTQAGNFSFTVTATGWGGCTATRSYTVQIVCPTIALSPASLPNGTVGSSYNQPLSVTPAGSYSFAVTAGALPTGLALNSATGALSGTPTQSGTFSFTITATGFGSCTGSQAYSLTILCPVITLTPAALPGAQAGIAYNQTLSVSPAGTYSFSLLTGNLPPGLNLNAATGVLSGLATATGSYNFSIQALGAGNCSGTKAYTLVVSCPPVTVNPASLLGGTVGAAYNQSLSATPAGSYTFAKTSGTLPPGLVIDNLFAALVGKPTAAGTYNFTLKATRSNGCTGTRAYTVVISGGSFAARRHDFDGDGRSELVLRQGEVWRLTWSTTGQTEEVRFGAAPDQPALGDYDGDGKTDLAVYQPAQTSWLVRLSSTGEVVEQAFGASLGGGLLPVAADYDGDGKTDLALWDGATARWHVQRSRDGKRLTFEFGAPGAVAVPADYDGDGRTDLAVFERAGGRWRIQHSGDGAEVEHQFGSPKDEPLVGDFDGDGKADLGLWRAAEAAVYLTGSTSQQTARVPVGLGSAADWLLLGDYDGDGKLEVAVWRALEGKWYFTTQREVALPATQQR